MSDSPSPETPWWDDEEKYAGFAQKLRSDPSFADLFAEAPAEKPKVAKGGGQQVKSTEMEGAMSSLVTALTEGMKLGATVGAAGAPKGTPKKKPPRTVRHWFFGETAVEDDEDE